MGSTFFLKKSVEYLTERGKIDTDLYVDLNEVNSFVWFLAEYAQMVSKFIEETYGQRIVIILDHCD